MTAVRRYRSDGDSTTIVGANGVRVTDDEGQEHLDFISRPYCVNAGHGNEAIIEATYDQLKAFQYVPVR